MLYNQKVFKFLGMNIWFIGLEKFFMVCDKFLGFGMKKQINFLNKLVLNQVWEIIIFIVGLKINILFLQFFVWMIC